MPALEATGRPNQSPLASLAPHPAREAFSIGRISRFGLVGVGCLLFQLATLHLLLMLFSIESRLGQNLANAVAFLLSAQLNYLVSRSFTWADRRCETSLSHRTRQQLAFNLLALGMLLVNQAVFFLLSPRVGELPASAVGALIASGLSLVLSGIFIFQRSSERIHRFDAIRDVPRTAVISFHAIRSTWLGRFCQADPYQAIVVAGAVVTSIASYLYYLHQGQLLSYADSISHPMIARRIIDSPTPGFSQIGGVWLPLPHLAALPFIWNDWFYFSGTAGAIISMVSFIALLVFAYQTARLIGCSPLASLVAPAVLAINPNMRYMQSVAMTELPLLLGIVVAVYYLIKWSQTESVWHMAGMIGGVLIASATRYEGWALWAAAFAGIAFVMLRKGWNRAKQIDYALFYLVFAGLMIPGWMLWNRVIIRTGWMGFTKSEYADSSIWVGPQEPSFGHPWVALKTYWFAMIHIAGLPLIGIAAAGLVIFLLRHRLGAGSVGLLVLLFPVPFFWLMLWNGQRPLHVPEITGDMYNIRFALQMLPFFAFMAAAVADALLRRIGSVHWRRLAFAATVLSLLMIAPLATITLDEPIAAKASDHRRADQEAAGEWMATHYPFAGRVLMETPGNEVTLFYSRLPLANVIYEGANQDSLWQRALADPSGHVDWLFMRITPGSEDKVARSMTANPGELAAFDLIYETADVRIYARRT